MQIYSDKLFSNPVEIIEVFDPCDIKNGLDKIEELKNKGLYLLGYIRYDLSKSNAEFPLLYFEAFDKYRSFIPQIPDFEIGTIIKPLITQEEYEKQVEYIKSKIRGGITYEVNYTYPSILNTNVDDFCLYNYLLQSQKTNYNAFLTNKYETILSFSPEMFFTLKNNKIYTKPMKGTVRRGKSEEEDNILKEFLYNDIKNRAENVMIVDLLRNDLGKIAKKGSVKVEKLFEIEKHKTLFQMTSEISAILEDNITLYDIIDAIYPCGSITGAPKLSTMRVIDEIEPFSREVYCGAIGYLYGNETVFSVPIRILQRKYNESVYKYFAGGAIVWDSEAKDEWEETIIKTKFLESGFSLIETGIDNFDLHLSRLKKSAKELGFVWNSEIENICFEKGVVSRVELFKDGRFELTTRSIPRPLQKAEIRLRGQVNSKNPFLYHKTSLRDKMPEAVFDEIRVNERGEITEGIFTNIAIEQDGQLYTPPVSSGLLNGIMRQLLLKEGKLKEKVLYPKDLKFAEKIYCFNSVRGIVEVKLC